VKGALVATLPKPILTDTAQFGSVWKSSRATLDVDYYHINFQNDYTSTTDPVSGETLYFLTSDSTTQGVEAESTLLMGAGFAVYLNGTAGTAKYVDTKQWVQNAPKDTETIGVTYNMGSWNVGLFNKRVGQMWQDNSSAHEAVLIDPFNITNLFVNYQLRGSSRLQATRIRFAVNNLTDSHAITGVTPASTTSNAPAAGDILTLMSGRSVSVSLPIGFSPKWPAPAGLGGGADHRRPLSHVACRLNGRPVRSLTRSVATPTCQLRARGDALPLEHDPQRSGVDSLR